ncbi:hypothetical protein N2152v2_007518 [Parachlorella kessleri]
MLRSRPSSVVVTWLARQAKTLAGGPGNEESKKEKRRRRRETNLRLKEWVSNQDTYWTASKAKGGRKEQHGEEEEDVDWRSDARLWERLIKDARSGTQRKRILKAYRQWQRGSSNGQEQQLWLLLILKRATGSDQQHRQRQQQQQRGRSAVGGGSTVNCEVASSLRALGLAEGTQVTGVVLKEAFRRSAMRWHPDRHPDAGSKAQAEARFKEAQAAFQLLTSLVVS